MPGFNYGGGVGDGTNWSSERGSEPSPGGGSNGHGGDRDNGGSVNATPAQKQLAAIQNDQALRQKLANLILAAHTINPLTKLKIEQVKPNGMLSISAEGLTADQATDIGLSGLVMGLRGNGVTIAIGDFNSGHPLEGKQPNNGKGGLNADTIAASSVGQFVTVLQGVLPSGYWLSNGKVMTKVRREITSGGGGKNGNEHTRIVTVEQEVPALTQAYKQGEAQRADVKDAVKFTADFYKEVTAKFSEQSAKVAQELAAAAKGKKIRNVEQALAAFDRFQTVLDKKYSVADREAIAKALESVNRANMASSLAKFSKGFGYVGKAIDAYDAILVELPKAIRTKNWRPFFVKVEAIAAGNAATALTAFVFSAITGSALGILGFALMMAIVGALVDEAFITKVNALLGV
ncbi:colicin pore forming domain-containing protein [Enterobacter sp. AG5470]|nr:colicin pore forming domain-containing protein [Enterobacter sp. AG5470]